MTRHEQLIELRERQHLPVAAIAERLGMKKNTVCSAIFELRRKGLITFTSSMNNGSAAPKRVFKPTKTDLEIIRLWNLGKMRRDIASEIGVTQPNVETRIAVLRDHGLDLPRRAPMQPQPKPAAPPKPKAAPPPWAAKAVIARRLPRDRPAPVVIPDRPGLCVWPMTCDEPALANGLCVEHGVRPAKLPVSGWREGMRWNGEGWV